MKLAVIGAGNMGGAIATAVIQAELVLPKNLLLIEPDEKSVKILEINSPALHPISLMIYLKTLI